MIPCAETIIVNPIDRIPQITFLKSVSSVLHTVSNTIFNGVLQTSLSNETITTMCILEIYFNNNLVKSLFSLFANLSDPVDSSNRIYTNAIKKKGKR